MGIIVKLGETTKFFKCLKLEKESAGTNSFSRKLQETTKELEYDNFDKTSR